MSVIIKEIISRQIIKNSLLNFISRSFVLTISVVFIAYISRKLSKFELGIFAVMNIFMGIIPLIVGLGLATSAIRLVPELKAKGNFEKVSDIIKLTVGLPIPETILITLLGVILSKFLSIVFLKTYQYSEYIIWIILISFFYSIFDRIILVYQSLQDFRKIAFLSIFMNLLSRISAIIFLSNGYGIARIFQGFLIGTIFGVIIGIFTLRKYIFSKYYGYPIKEYIRFSFPYYLQGWARFAFNQADQFLVALMFIPEILAVYFIAKKVVSLFVLVLESLLEPIVPRLAEKKGQSIEIFFENYKKSYYTFSLFAFLSSLFLLINSKNLMYLLGGSKFYNQFLVLNILSVSIFFYFLFSLYSIFVYLMYAPLDILKINILVGIANMLFGFLLGLKFALIGFAIVQSIGFILGIFMIYYNYKEPKSFGFLLDDIKNSIIVIFIFFVGYILNLYFLPLMNSFLAIIKNLIVNLLLFSFFCVFILRKKIKKIIIKAR
jgi:O-antigen/teichoic acid export membrane protein